jgi:hypothetical protein
MKLPLALLAMTLLGVSSTACGSASKNTAATTTTGGTAASASSARSGRPPQDDNHISTYGYEATEPDKREITALVERYYAAVAADDGAKACSLLYSTIAKSVAEDYGKPPASPVLRGKTCSVVLSKLFKHVPGQSIADLATTRVTGVRLKGNFGFVQLSSRTMPTGRIVVERERNTWKIDQVISRACTDCAAAPAAG